MSRIIRFNQKKYFNLDTRKLYIDGNPTEEALQGISFRILEFLALNSPNFMSESTIRKNCWRKINVGDEEESTGSLSFHIMNLRRAIDDMKVSGTKKYTYIVESDGAYCCVCGITNESALEISDLDNKEETHIPDCNLELSTPEFFHKYLDLHCKGKIKIEEICLSFFNGSRWLTSSKRINILHEIYKEDIPCHILINGESESIRTVHKNMLKNEKNPISPEYPPALEGIKSWDKRKRTCSNMEVRISLLPLLHSYYSIKLADNKSESVIRVAFYTYGNIDLNSCYVKIFNGKSQFYELYCEEFKFLWDKAMRSEDYLNDIEKKENKV